MSFLDKMGNWIWYQQDVFWIHFCYLQTRCLSLHWMHSPTYSVWSQLVHRYGFSLDWVLTWISRLRFCGTSLTNGVMIWIFPRWRARLLLFENIFSSVTQYDHSCDRLGYSLRQLILSRLICWEVQYPLRYIFWH